MTKITINKDRKKDMQLNNLKGTLVASVDDGNVRFSSNMGDEDAWIVLAMALVSQSHKLGLEKNMSHELLDNAWKRVGKQTLGGKNND